MIVTVTLALTVLAARQITAHARNKGIAFLAMAQTPESKPFRGYVRRILLADVCPVKHGDTYSYRTIPEG